MFLVYFWHPLWDILSYSEATITMFNIKLDNKK